VKKITFELTAYNTGIFEGEAIYFSKVTGVRTARKEDFKEYEKLHKGLSYFKNKDIKQYFLENMENICKIEFRDKSSHFIDMDYYGELELLREEK